VVGANYGAPRKVELKGWRWAALALCLMVLLNPVSCPISPCSMQRFRRMPHAGDAIDADACIYRVVFTELSSTQLALKTR